MIGIQMDAAALGQSGMSPSAWRDPEFIASVRSMVSRPQFDRFKRMFHQPFYVLSGSVDEAQMRFAVSGSERNEYTLHVVRSTGRVTCDCRDATGHCRRLGAICKHACFLLYRVLRHDDATPMLTQTLGGTAAFDALLPRARRVAARTATGDPDDREDDGVTAPARAVLSPSEIDRICEAMQRMPLGGRAYGTDKRRPFTAVGRQPEPDAECPVCYDTLLQLPADLRGCPSCGQAVHAHCARRWIASAPRATCVYCRSPEWAHWDGK